MLMYEELFENNLFDQVIELLPVYPLKLISIEAAIMLYIVTIQINNSL